MGVRIPPSAPFDSLAWHTCSLAHGRPDRRGEWCPERAKRVEGHHPYVYILRCRDGTLWTGHTADLEARLEAHNQGVAAKHTSNRRPVKLIYFEIHDTEATAIARERQLKSWSAKKKLALASGDVSLVHSLSARRQQ